MTTQERYDNMREKFLKGEISVKVWIEFVNDILEDLLQEEEETLKRLKEI